jgi:hypothetical protein
MGRKALLFILPFLTGILFFELSFGHDKLNAEKKLREFFPEAEHFTSKEKALTPEEIQGIEGKLGEKLVEVDKTPLFYIAKKEEKPMGLAYFTEGETPMGPVHSGVALDLKGKILQVSFDSEVADETFLNQFVGKGVDDKFQVGEDLQALRGNVETSQSIANLPKKSLLLAYAALLKSDPGEEAEKGEPESLKELMHRIQKEYIVLRDYFGRSEITEMGENSGGKEAVSASRNLVQLIGQISNFEPEKNKSKKKEFLLIHKQVHEATKDLEEFVREGNMKDAKKYFDDIVMFVEMAHKRFSEHSVDIDHVHEHGEEHH